MTKCIALLDACVLYPAAVRDIMMEYATRDIFQAKWTDRIHDEWIAALLRDRPDIPKVCLEKMRQLINNHALDSLVEDYAHLENDFVLPDANDHHVLAAAIHAKANFLITNNARDFPQAVLDQYGITRLSPDAFLMHLAERDMTQWLAVFHSVRLRLRNPPKTVQEYIALLENKHKLLQTATLLKQYQKAL